MPGAQTELSKAAETIDKHSRHDRKRASKQGKRSWEIARLELGNCAGGAL